MEKWFERLLAEAVLHALPPTAVSKISVHSVDSQVTELCILVGMSDQGVPKSVMKDPVTWLYPLYEPYNTGRLQVSPIHEIYFEESGNPSGKPVVFMHGGPGGGSEPKQRRFFHPAKYHIINFDQRGCGKKSIPRLTHPLEANTTWDLVDDIEKIREHLSNRAVAGVRRILGFRPLRWPIPRHIQIA